MEERDKRNVVFFRVYKRDEERMREVWLEREDE
jgi:hypothetical protein